MPIELTLELNGGRVFLPGLQGTLQCPRHRGAQDIEDGPFGLPALEIISRAGKGSPVSHRSTATYMFLPPKQLPAYDEFLRLASQTPDKHKQDAIADEPSRRLQRGKTCKREADVYRVETSSRGKIPMDRWLFYNHLLVLSGRICFCLLTLVATVLPRIGTPR